MQKNFEFESNINYKSKSTEKCCRHLIFNFQFNKMSQRYYNNDSGFFGFLEDTSHAFFFNSKVVLTIKAKVLTKISPFQYNKLSFIKEQSVRKMLLHNNSATISAELKSR